MIKFILILCSIFFLIEANTTRGLKKVYSDSGTQILSYEGSYALLIGVSDYTNGWTDLETIPSELKNIKKTLEDNGFKVKTIINPNSKELEYAYSSFIDKYGYDKNNRLLFFYSGHGYTTNNGSKGYLVPTDAPNPAKNLKDFKRKSLNMSRLLSLSREMEANHALFLFDSCFSGTIFKTRALPKSPQHIQKKMAKPVRQFITSGSAGEEVPAKSVFTPLFSEAIEGDADLNKDGYVTGSELGMFLSNTVPEYKAQTPQYGKINDFELSRGDFVFLVPKKSTPDSKNTKDLPNWMKDSAAYSSSSECAIGYGRSDSFNPKKEALFTAKMELGFSESIRVKSMHKVLIETSRENVVSKLDEKVSKHIGYTTKKHVKEIKHWINPNGDYFSLACTDNKAHNEPIKSMIKLYSRSTDKTSESVGSLAIENIISYELYLSIEENTIKETFNCKQAGIAAPEWICRPMLEGGIAGVGVAKIYNEDFLRAYATSTANARTDIAFQIDSILQEKRKKEKTMEFTREIKADEKVDKVMTSFSKNLTSQTIYGSKVVKLWQNKKTSELFVLVVVPEEQLNKSINESIEESLKNDKKLWKQYQKQLQEKKSK